MRRSLLASFPLVSPLVSLVVSLALPAFGVAAVGCGPSFQAVYEGDARFEHCYALEENPTLAMQAKAGCWDEWLRGYTYGATRDRVDYAVSRSRALRAGGELPTDEAMMQAAPGEGRDRSVAFAPRNAFAPPPKTMADVTDGGSSMPVASNTSSSTWGVAALVPSDAGPPPKLAPPPPSSELSRCTDACRDAWNTCQRDDAKKNACDKPFRACLRSCAR